MTVLQPSVAINGEIPLILNVNGDSLKAQSPVVNTIEVNGTEVNGTEVNGTEVNGTKVNGIKTSLATSHANGDATDPFSLNQQYAYTSRKLKVITIGAGFSGLILAHKFQHRFPEMQDIVENTIFEERSDVGGTWLVNHYPGVQCDVPAHIYVIPTLIYLHKSSSDSYHRHFHSIPIQTGTASMLAVKIFKVISRERSRSGILTATYS